MSIQSFERRLNSALAAVEVGGLCTSTFCPQALPGTLYTDTCHIHCYQVRIYETKTRLLYIPSTVQVIIAVASFSIRH